MNSAMTKEIKFYEDTLMGVQAESGEIYLAVKNTAMNIGLTDKQADAEVSKIQTLDLFKSNHLKFKVVQNEGDRQVTRETVCLLEKFVPMWLSQINITPKMKLSNPEACAKLLQYQLECVDILHKAFMGDEDDKKNFYDRFDINIENIMSAKLDQYITPLNNKIISLESHILNNNKVIDIANEHNFLLQNKLIKLEETVTNISNKFKISYNKSALFEKLKVDFLSFINYSDTTNYNKFYDNLDNWLGITVPRKGTNTKQWILKNIEMSVIEEFVNGVIIGRIVKSKKGNWVDLSGIYENQVEWEKILRSFDYKCSYCGSPSDKLVGEHIICQSDPKSSNRIENLICGCLSCNYSKYNNNITEWYKGKDFYTEDRWDAICNHYKNYAVDMNTTNT